ncbi:hypothetical protein DL240_15535 [Lujinxingia litoralis]|uniref:Uncharacterized protein n=1 Tax=Lujinxingia litoralis TaxID=2211119 RepID=A0A328C816_9DELT|nr:putative metal-binding motif-containing protein [Lujinxingia litoralis]RAL20728.1 hypothetical protein DL240_15535 [Lujinxingia litoralis]
MKRAPLAPIFALLLLTISLLAACGSDSTSSEVLQCGADELLDQQANACVPRTTIDENDVGDDADVDRQDVEDPEPDVEDEDTFDPSCDSDNDGELSYACGGMDCDDNDHNTYPGAPEICDGKDNNCNTLIDEGVSCTFYAHTNDGLYSINPFEGTANRESDLVDWDMELVRLLDIDTHPMGVLFGVTRNDLYAFYDAENVWIKVAWLGDVGDANGLAIDGFGTAYVTAENHFLKFDLAEVEAIIQEHGFDEREFRNLRLYPEQITVTGDTEYYSSGDCVVNKQNTFYMTSKHEEGIDHLIEIDRSTGAATNLGPTSDASGNLYRGVYGLTAGWGKLFGITSSGDLLELNSSTGQAELITSFGEGKRWYGSASTPQR